MVLRGADVDDRLKFQDVFSGPVFYTTSQLVRRLVYLLDEDKEKNTYDIFTAFA